MVYTTGIAWRNDKIKTPPTAFKNGYDIFWHAQKPTPGRSRSSTTSARRLTMALLHRGVTNVNTGEREAARQAAPRMTSQTLTKTVNVKTNTTEYTDVPTGATWLGQGWSGDMAGALNYMPKGVPVTARRLLAAGEGRRRRQ